MSDSDKNLVMKPLLWGTLAAILLLSAYFAILSLLNSPLHAWQQFILLWPWMSLLVIGFGVQMGLFTYLREYQKKMHAEGTCTAAVAATGGVSTGSMITCCLHHAVDVLPFLGLSAAAIFLTKYQAFFLALGIVSNLIGMTFVLYTIQKNGLYVPSGGMSRLRGINLKLIFYGVIIGGALFLTGMLLYLLK